MKLKLNTIKTMSFTFLVLNFKSLQDLSVEYRFISVNFFLLKSLCFKIVFLCEFKLSLLNF